MESCFYSCRVAQQCDMTCDNTTRQSDTLWNDKATQYVAIAVLCCLLTKKMMDNGQLFVGTMWLCCVACCVAMSCVRT